jgi:replication factor C large subunit
VTVLDWTEKYRPKVLNEVLGNAKAVAELRKWAESWEHNNPIKKGVILAGPAGTGKTSSATALANEFGWSLIELNASDARNMATIRRVATTGAMNQTFSLDGSYLISSHGGRKLIVLDEADSLYEGSASTGGSEKKDLSDRGGKRAIVETLELTKQPIILIVNDLYGLIKGSGSALKNSTITIKFYKLKEATIQQAIRGIAEKEKIKMNPDVIEALARRSEGDLRACINDLQSLAIGRSIITLDAVSAVGNRDISVSIFDAVRDVFRGTSTSRIHKTFLNVDESTDNIILWIDENLPLEYKRPEDLKNGFNMLSRADVFIGRVRKRQHFKFMSYSKDLMTAGVASVKQHSYSGWQKYNFPSWLKKMSYSKESRGLYSSLSRKLARYNHVSTRTIKSDLISSFKHLFKTDKEFAVSMIIKLEFDRDEIAHLLNDKPISNRVKSLMEEVKRKQELELSRDSEEVSGGAGSITKPKSVEVELKVPKKGRTKKTKKPEKEIKPKKEARKKKSKEKSVKESAVKKKADAVIKSKKDENAPGEDEGASDSDQEPDSKTQKKKELQKSLFDF